MTRSEKIEELKTQIHELQKQLAEEQKLQAEDIKMTIDIELFEAKKLIGSYKKRFIEGVCQHFHILDIKLQHDSISVVKIFAVCDTVLLDKENNEYRIYHNNDVPIVSISTNPNIPFVRHILAEYYEYSNKEEFDAAVENVQQEVKTLLYNEPSNK